MKIENLNIFDRVSGAKDQNSGSSARSSQSEDQKSSKSDDAFAKLLNSNRKPVEKSPTSTRHESEERGNDVEDTVEASSVDTNRKPIPDRVPVTVPRSAPVAKTKENSEEVKPEDIRKPSKSVEIDVAGQQVNRRAALQTFLKKMKEQLNVQPEQLMAAFSSLSIEELTSPPEMNMEKIIQGLNLSEEQKPVAKQLFEDMMKQTAANSMAEQLKASGQQLSLQVLSQKEIQQQQLNQSLSKMNQNFFMAEQKPMLQNPVLAKQPVVNQNSQTMTEQSLSENQSGVEIPGFVPVTEKMELTQNAPKAQAATTAANSSVTLQSLAENLDSKASEIVAPKVPVQPASVASKSVAPASVPVESVPLAAGQPATPEMLSAIMPQAKFGAASSFFSNAEVETDDEAALDAVAPKDMKTSQMDAQLVEKLKAALQAQANQDDNSDMGQDGELSSKDLNVQPQMDQSKAPGFEKAMTSTLASKQVAPGQDSNNVKELINQAQFMIKKGGGEMKIRLTPEGLGEVSMKVHVHNGQVNVEMVTESSDAKKLIENGLGDLKATLASHKLNVDQIKVDISHQTAKDFQQQHEQASRHQAQQFMEEFRQDNQQWRQSFYDVPGAKAYKSQTRDEADNSYMTPQSSKKSSNASRRLDLVA